MAARLRLDQPVAGPGVPLTDAQWARIEPLLPALGR
ncbi:transposase [Streptomyces sp. NBC_00879]|nr:transposase [Streptomyces sp. NBC_00879]